MRSIAKCAICVLREQGVTDPEKLVLPQYVALDPTKPPVPFGAENAEMYFDMFPEERPVEGETPPPTGGVMGTPRGVYRVMGFAKEIIKKLAELRPKSRKVAERNERKSVFEE